MKIIFVLFLISLSISTYVRKNQANMSQEEIEKFVNAVLEMKNNTVYDQFVRLHSLTFITTRTGPIIVNQVCTENPESPECFDWAHGGPQFLPWHREFLLRFEQELQKIDPDVTLPYWNWSIDNSTDPSINHLWSDYFMGGNGDTEEHNFVTTGPFAYWPLLWGTRASTLTRKFTKFGTLPTPSQIDGLMNTLPYDEPPYSMNGTTSTPTFRKSLEGFPPLPDWDPSIIGYMHNNVHGWVGGEMLTSTSPNDPVFFLHHCFIDYLWEQWMIENPNTVSYLPIVGGPSGTNVNDYLIPWDNIHNTPEYEYSYQYPNVAPEGYEVKISKMNTLTSNLGYVYEDLIEK